MVGCETKAFKRFLVFSEDTKMLDGISKSFDKYFSEEGIPVIG